MDIWYIYTYMYKYVYTWCVYLYIYTHINVGFFWKDFLKHHTLKHQSSEFWYIMIHHPALTHFMRTKLKATTYTPKNWKRTGNLKNEGLEDDFPFQLAIYIFSTVYFLGSMLIFQLYNPRKSKDQTLPLGSRESFTWTILKAILCLVLDLQGNFTKTQIYVVPLHSISPPPWVIPWSHAPHPNSSRCPEWPGFWVRWWLWNPRSNYLGCIKPIVIYQIYTSTMG